LDTAERLGERRIIEAIWKHLDRGYDMPVPFGDDVSAIEHNGQLAVLKTDMLVAKTDMPPQMTYWQAARKAIIMNISDFAAKGVEPLGLLVSLGIPSHFTRSDIEQIARGLAAGAKEYGSYVVGGDTNETDDLIISISAFGSAEKGVPILRSGARSGDVVATTGAFGSTASGLKILTEKFDAPKALRKRLIDSVLMPHARLEEGLALAKTGAATASIDSSDGLAWSLHEISRASNVGFTLDCLPISQETLEFAKVHGLEPLALALYGGEEYELVVTINPQGWPKARTAVARCGGNLMKIGQVTSDKTLVLRQKTRAVEIEARGYEHFKPKGRD
jgi:thiamine-monophosphate kinase